MLTYSIRPIGDHDFGQTPWADPLWAKADVAHIDQFHAKSSDHHPRVNAKVLYDRESLHLRFEVQDQYVLSRAQQFQDSVCIDSCVEFFVKPRADKGYFNFEFNAGGTLLLHYIEDPTRTPEGFKKSMPVSWEHASGVTIKPSLPSVVWPERTDPVTWWMYARIPVKVLEPYCGPLGELGGQSWTANFYKCADHSSHPHWGSWSPIGEVLRFHQPDRFGQIDFSRDGVA